MNLKEIDKNLKSEPQHWVT